MDFFRDKDSHNVAAGAEINRFGSRASTADSKRYFGTGHQPMSVNLIKGLGGWMYFVRGDRYEVPG
jgi:hypothetical protein